MKTKTEFTPELLYTDELKQNNTLNIYYYNIEKLNNFILECSELLQRNFTKKEIQSAVKDPAEFSETIKSIIQDTFPFPKANADFNLTAMGLSFDGLDMAVSVLRETDYKCIINKSEILPDPDYIKEIKDSSKVYTVNARQTEVYLLAKELKDIADKLAEMKITNHMSRFNYQRATSSLIQLDTTNQLKINYNKLLTLF